MTTPCDPTQAPAADSVQKIQEELAGITLDPPSNGAVSHKCETANEPMPTNVNYTDGASILENSVKMMLFGGAISCSFPPRYGDISDFRDVPNNQEAFVDPNRDESFIIELLELKENVADAGSARWFLEDLAVEQAFENTLIVEDESRIPAANIPNLEANTTVNAVIGTMEIAKGRQGVEASNNVRVYLANIRLRVVETDILITVYEPLNISEHSESAAAVGAGATLPAAQAGLLPAADVFKQVLSTFRIHDWSLFGYVDE
ncbi:uncharacterized protein [Physcomitrium patens]|uniref:Ran guanine nucleotide release factor n=1 Tax=Physcomitrium patens TaxID=3218 RepID=A0A2K1JD52_PHYPA|nr:probable ran guanine nucleotide release factor [Physcomitrium patens]PNR39453.1 hypothetical protein PHYPA_019731 [Physcomitrium patens]|eukprot:XP_024396857.1 probable ran guanine nucleotide release factor [Physcomitrella patens]